MSVVAGTFILGVFALLTVASIPHITHLPWHPFLAPGGHVTESFGVGLSIALWNYIGWDNASTVQGEVVNPGRSYPKALAITLPLVTCSYLLPLMATLEAEYWTQWQA